MKTGRQFHSRWFRVYDEALDDPKLQMLSDKLHRFLFNCWCMASKNGGYLPPIPEIAWRLRMTEAKAAALIAELHERDLLDDEADTFTPHNWCSRQFDSDVSTERVRRFRERKRNVSETVSETAPDSDTETDTETDTEKESNAPKNGALSLVSRKRRSSHHRTTEEIRTALGDRLIWWESFWEVYPCHEGMNAAMDAFEKRVTTRELAEQVYRGAKAYAQRLTANPEIQAKYGQGWINGERWLDENRIRDPPIPSMPKTRQQMIVDQIDRL